MKREFLVDALGGIDPAYVDEAGAFLYAETGSGGKKRPARKTLGTLLIAAAIVSLLTATAFAAGLLGLRDQLRRARRMSGTTTRRSITPAA